MSKSHVDNFSFMHNHYVLEGRVNYVTSLENHVWLWTLFNSENIFKLLTQ